MAKLGFGKKTLKQLERLKEWLNERNNHGGGWSEGGRRQQEAQNHGWGRGGRSDGGQTVRQGRGQTSTSYVRSFISISCTHRHNYKYIINKIIKNVLFFLNGVRGPPVLSCAVSKKVKKREKKLNFLICAPFTPLKTYICRSTPCSWTGAPYVTK